MFWLYSVLLYLITSINGVFLLVFLISFILVGGSLSLYERKLLSLIQKRVGPEYVGYKGRAQLFADALKVLLKKNINLRNINIFNFSVFFNLYFLYNLFILNFIYFSKYVVFFPSKTVLLLMVYILLLSNLLLLLVGFFTNNRYSFLAVTRLVNLLFLGELLFILFITIIIFFCSSLSIKSLFFTNEECLNGSYILLFLPLLYIIVLFDTARAPFDLVESESEMIMGYTIEYSGFFFGGFVLIEYLHIFLFAYLLSLCVY